MAETSTILIIPKGALKMICVYMNPVRVDLLENFLNTICPLYGISTADIMHEFLANVMEESNEFRRYEENLTYTHAFRIQEVFGIKRFPTLESAEAYVGNAKALANKVYGGRKDLGNTEPDDGFNFRGSGPIQLTGRLIVTQFAQWMRSKFSISKVPEDWAMTLRSSDEYGVHSACWFFGVAKNLIQAAIDDNMKEIVKRINGGLNGYPERMRYYELCKKYIV